MNAAAILFRVAKGSCLLMMHGTASLRSKFCFVLATLSTCVRGQVIGRYPGVQYEALRDDHCFDPKGAAKSTLYCSKNAGDHGRQVCKEAGGKYDDQIAASKKACIDRCTEEGDVCVGIRWQAVVQHCTILYGVCEDSNDGKNFRSEYWRKLQNSDFETPNVGLSTCNGTMLPCSDDGTDPCEAQEDCMKMYHGCGDGFMQCSLDVLGACRGVQQCYQPCVGRMITGKVDCKELNRATCLHSFVERSDGLGEECMLVDERSCSARKTCGVIYPE